MNAKVKTVSLVSLKVQQVKLELRRTLTYKFARLTNQDNAVWMHLVFKNGGETDSKCVDSR